MMRSLILAGGGLKVAYQAGCLQVLLDEAGLTFDHVDAASGGCFNAALLANGYSGTQIANFWRDGDPLAFFSPDYGQLTRLFWARSVGTSAGIRRVIREQWKLDFEWINARRDVAFTFNVGNFSAKRVDIVDQSGLTEDLLVAATSLVMWLPPVQSESGIFFDAVYNRDANVGEAVRRGADEIWAIWTVSTVPEFRNGFIAQYFHLIEMIAGTRFREEWDEIVCVNAGIERYGTDASRITPDLRLAPPYDSHDPPRPPAGRKPIALHLIEQEVPMHYLLVASRDRAATAVDMGIRDTRRYCGVDSRTIIPTYIPHERIGLSFLETMGGFVHHGATKYDDAFAAGKRAGSKLRFKVCLAADDVDVYLGSENHEATATGTLLWSALGEAEVPVHGVCRLFVLDRDEDGRVIPGRKRFEYELDFQVPDGNRYVLRGVKQVSDEPGHRLWGDTTRMFADVIRVDDSGTESLEARGILRMSVAEFMRELTTFRVSGSRSPVTSMQTVVRFGAFFFGQAWDVYARHVLDYAPF